MAPPFYEGGNTAQFYVYFIYMWTFECFVFKFDSKKGTLLLNELYVADNSTTKTMVTWPVIRKIALRGYAFFIP